MTATTDKPSLRWTEHTFTCLSCKRVCRASQEAIDKSREFAGDKDATDADIAGSFEYCLGCCDGVTVSGEVVSTNVLRDRQPDASDVALEAGGARDAMDFSMRESL